VQNHPSIGKVFLSLVGAPEAPPEKMTPPHDEPLDDA
jgi:hypothetical protein